MNGRPPAKALLVNAGSTSLRLDAYDLGASPQRLASASFSPAPAADGQLLQTFVHQHDLERPAIVMHRVVHGGTRQVAPCLLTPTVLADIERLTALAPLHNTVSLGWIDAARRTFPEPVLHAACFDTAFYQDLPPPAAHYAVPQALAQAHGLRRYGFHGLAHQSLLERWQSLAPSHTNRRVISLQLGGGCSITATDRGQPVETSMGFSPLEGLMMATRAGNIDAAAVLHLIEQGGLSAPEVGRLLNQSAGLRGVSGESADMQVLLDSDTDDARLAIAMFCHRLRLYIGAYLAILGGADAIVFGGGIGQNAPAIRARALDRLGWAGISLDPDRNAAVSPQKGGSIHRSDSQVEVWVIPTDEARVMARASHHLLTHPSAAMPAEE